MKEEGKFGWGDIVVIDETYIALIEETGRLSTLDCPFQYYDQEQHESRTRYARPEEIKTFMVEMLRNGRILHLGFDTVNKPEHYASSKIECIDAMESAFGIEAVKHFCLCNAFKYIFRSQKKNGVEDFEKAMWYENKYIELSKRSEK